MTPNSKYRIATTVRTIVIYTLLIITILIMGFAMLSGAEDYGGGISGIIKNSPNALPWLGLLILVLVAWRWEFIGGLLITLGGVFLMFFFNSGPNFFQSTFILTSMILVLGVSLLLSWYIRKNSEG